VRAFEDIGKFSSSESIDEDEAFRCHVSIRFQRLCSAFARLVFVAISRAAFQEQYVGAQHSDRIEGQ
jgi:hypothetical protein